MEKVNFNFAFFGTSGFSIGVLEALKKRGFFPSLIVTLPDSPKGRKLVLTPPPVKSWAEKNNIPYVQPKKISGEEFAKELLTKSPDKKRWNIFIVASYGKIIPVSIFEIPTYKTLNVHPSLLPRLRGASPIQEAILQEDETGVTIMVIDAEMDHGPVIVQEKVPVKPWPVQADILEKILSEKGGEILADVLPKWVAGRIASKEQEHTKATYTNLIKKEDGEIDIHGNPRENWKKFLAYVRWPGVHFFIARNGSEIRVIIKDAEFRDGKFVITRVLPEGGREMDYESFLRGNRSLLPTAEEKRLPPESHETEK